MGNRCWHWSLMGSASWWQTDTISIHMKPVCFGFFANAWNNASQSMYEGPQWQMNGGSWASLVYDGRQRVCSHRLCVVVLAVCQRSIAIQANLQGSRDGCVCSCFLAGSAVVRHGFAFCVSNQRDRSTNAFWSLWSLVQVNFRLLNFLYVSGVCFVYVWTVCSCCGHGMPSRGMSASCNYKLWVVFWPVKLLHVHCCSFYLSTVRGMIGVPVA